MKFGSINIPSSVGLNSWRKCWNIMADQSSVWGVQESFLRSNKALYRALSLKRGVKFFGLKNSPNPIFWKRKQWKFISGDVVLLSDYGPNRDKWPGFNDRRYMTVVTLQRRLRGNRLGRVHTFINIHWPADAGEDKTPQWYLNSARKKARLALIEEVESYTAQGNLVWFMGDTNIYEEFVVKEDWDNVVWVWVKGTGIDKIAYARKVKSDVRIHAKTLEVPAPTDHHNGLVTTAYVTKVEK